MVEKVSSLYVPYEGSTPIFTLKKGQYDFL